MSEPNDLASSSGVSAEGWVDPRYQSVHDLLERTLQERPGWGAAVAVYVDGRLVVDLWGGASYRAETVQFAYSSTKGVASLCLALLIERGELDPDATVAAYWPEFAQAGKGQIPVRWLLSHQAGLAAVNGAYSLDDYIAHNVLAARLAAQAPAWPPGQGHGYHALTWGTLTDELCRRITGMPLGEFYEAELRGPNAIDFFVGLPDREASRVTFSATLGPNEDDGQQWPESELAERAVKPNAVFPGLAEIERLRQVRAAALPAISGIGSARGLAKLYAVCTTGIGTAPKLSARTMRNVATTQARGKDLILPFDTSFGLGFQTPSDRLPLAGPGSFGHDGYAGSLGLASPEHGIALGFFTDHVPMPYGGADRLATELTAAVVAQL